MLVKLLSIEDNWVKVYDTTTNKTGYISRSYVIYTNEVPSNLGYRKVTQNTNIYSEKGSGYLGTVRKDSIVTLLSIEDNWVKIYDTATNKTGYISRSYVIYTNEVPVKTQQTSVNDKIEKIIALGYKQLGKRYVYGTAGPNTFDCSGLTSYLFKNGAGVTIPRTSSDQSKTGQYVNLSQLKRGDLIFFGNKKTGSVNHVALYLGDNKYLHSPRTGDVVKIVDTNSSHFKNTALHGRRIIQ